MSTKQPSYQYKCYSAGPGLFPRDLPDGKRETWEEAQARVRAQDAIISASGIFSVITPSNAGLAQWEPQQRPRICLLTDLLYASQAPIVFADVTPMGDGAEPDSGTVVEAVTCALNGGILVLWSEPLTTFAEKYAHASIHPDSELDLHYNLMLEQLFYRSWEVHFGHHVPVFDSLKAAVAATEAQVQLHGVRRISLLDRLLNSAGSLNDVQSAVKRLLSTTKYIIPG